MKAGIPLPCLMYLLFAAGCGDFNPPLAGDAAPVLTATGLDGNPFSWEDVPAAKVYLLQFYANSCCADQLPATSELYREYQAKGLSVIAVNVLDSPESVREQIEQLALELPIALDQARSTSGRYCLARLPTTFFLDPGHIIRAKIVGQASREELARHVEFFLKTAPGSNSNHHHKEKEP